MKCWKTLTLLGACGLAAAGCNGDEGTLPEGASAEECSDDLDNDGDGTTDCDDVGCYKYEACDGGPADTDPGDSGDSGDSGDTGDGSPSFDDAGLCINEFMANNSTTITDENGAYPDWIELHNSGDAAIDLSGYTITDDLDEPDKHVLPEGTTIAAGGYWLLWADGGEYPGDRHLNFKLGSDGESLGLYRPDGSAVQKLEYAAQASDRSAARKPNCGSNWCITSSPSPDADNGAPLDEDTCSEDQAEDTGG